MSIELGDYLVARLVQLDVRAVMMVPGDFNLTLLDRLEDAKEINLVGCCNELNAAYAADGYSRTKQTQLDRSPSSRPHHRALGCLVTTFGVGELSAINGIAGAYAERVPILHIVGVPSTELQESSALLHHTLGAANIPFDVYKSMSKPITAAQAFLTSIDSACDEIDRVLRVALESARPTYLTIPTNFVSSLVDKSRLDTPIVPTLLEEDKDLVRFVAKEIERLWDQAKNPVVIIDACAGRFGVQHLVQELIEATGIKYFTTPMSKAILNEDPDLGFGGLYVGDISNPAVKDLVESADLTLRIGSLQSDFNSGGFTSQSPVLQTIELHSDSTHVQYAKYDVSFYALLPALVAVLRGKEKRGIDAPEHVGMNKIVPAGDEHAMVKQDAFWPLIGRLLLRKDDIIITETGTSSFGILDVAFPDGATSISQVLYGSIGFSVGATLGAALAAKEAKVKRRTILFVGDGSLQLGVQEIATMIRQGLKPIIVILNNSGYVIERFIHGENREYNEIASFKWQEMISFFNGDNVPSRTWLANTRGELIKVLSDEEFGRAETIQVLEVRLGRMDAPRALVEQAKLSAKLNS